MNEIEYNQARRALINAIQQLEIRNIRVEFEGSGDSGQIDYISVYTAAGHMDQPLPMVPTNLVVRTPTIDPTNGHGWVEELVDVIEIRLDSLINNIVDYELDHSGVDWYNNDGGHGYWEYYNGRFTFEVNRRHVSSETEEFYDEALEDIIAEVDAILAGQLDTEVLDTPPPVALYFDEFES